MLRGGNSRNGGVMNFRLWFLMLLVGASSLASGCAGLGVKPWQRDVLARQEMQLNRDPIDAAIDDHMYFSKEASSGGRSFAGGGCGCN
jgi:hypothetical protein